MKMRKELNNKGFSLVELLIATIILGIVVAPLLHSFVTAASTTVRSRQIGEATLLGENVAELVETTDLKNLETLFENPSFDTNPTDPNNNPPASTYSVNSVNDTEVYSLSAQGVPSGGSTFNVKVTLDPSPYRTGDQDNRRVNDVKLSDYSVMDAIYAQSLDVDNPDELAWFAFKTEADRVHEGEADGENVSEKQVWDPDSAEPVRTITLDITKNSDNEIEVVLSKTYTYSYVYYDTTTKPGETIRCEGSITVGPFRYNMMKNGAYSLAANRNRLPNIYVMYYPIYESESVTNDIIRINNMVGGEAEPFKIFLVKEETKTQSGDKDPYLATKEYNYMATLEQYVPAGTDENDFAVVYSNIRENLRDGSNLGNKVTYQIYRGNYFSIKGRFGGDNPDNDPNYKGGDLVSRTERNRLFDVTVEIYDAKDTTFTTPIHTFHATKLQ